MRSHAYLMTMLMLIGSLAGCTLTDPKDVYDDTECDDVYIAPVFTLQDYGEGIENTINLDNPAPMRVHRAADILGHSDLGDEPTSIGAGPNIVLDYLTFFGLTPNFQADRYLEIDAISGFKPILEEEFMLAFSVDLTSEGNGIGSTYNVRNQSSLNHAYGDVFFALPSYELDGTITPDRITLHLSGTGSTLAMDSCYASNQIDFDLAPNATRDDPWPNDTYDDVDGISYDNLGAEGDILFSLSINSTKHRDIIDILPENTNGADVLWRHPNGTITTFAKHEELGLSSDDELDALVVFDNGDKQWGEGDTILFSLARGSHTLTAYNWTAGDVLVASHMSLPQMFSPIDQHGLEKGDELNALGIMRNAEVFGDINPEIGSTTPPG